MKQTAVYAVTRTGGELGRFVADHLSGDLFMPERFAGDYGASPFTALKGLVREQFSRYSNHIFITAAGIAVRAIAPWIRSKNLDPAVVVVDQRGRFCISLLSGHIGGANELAKRIAALIRGEAVITTATDVEGLTSIDTLALERGMKIANPTALKPVNAAILDGEPIQVYDSDNRLGLVGTAFTGDFRFLKDMREWEPCKPGIVVTWQLEQWEDLQLVLHPSCLVAGVGCNKGTQAGEIITLARKTFEAGNLSIDSLKALATIEEKRNEKGLLEAAEALGVGLVFFTAKELSSAEVPNPSDTVERHMGVRSVCEAAAIVGARQGKLIVPKTKNRNATVAIALER
jgi:cobalt-precorrin 5A hydrolase